MSSNFASLRGLGFEWFSEIILQPLSAVFEGGQCRQGVVVCYDRHRTIASKEKFYETLSRILAQFNVRRGATPFDDHRLGRTYWDGDKRVVVAHRRQLAAAGVTDLQDKGTTVDQFQQLGMN